MRISILKTIKYSIKLMFAALAVFFLHAAAVYFLPEPFLFVNIFVVIGLYILFLYGFKPGLWAVFIAVFMAELVNGANLGLMSLAIFLSMLAMSGFERNYITSRSLVSLLVTLAVGLMVYRFAYVLFSEFIFVLQFRGLIAFSYFYTVSIYELLLSGAFCIILYPIFAKLSARQKA